MRSDVMIGGPRRLLVLIALAVCGEASQIQADEPKQKQAPASSGKLSFQQNEGSLTINLAGQSIGEYIWNDKEVRRPYFRHLRTPSSRQVTRNYPPKAGDLADHSTYHPGLGMAFGEMGGADFWRNKGLVRQVEFIQKPVADDKGGSFTVRNSYENGDRMICSEDCRFTITPQASGYLLAWDSTFRADQNEFAFGDQEEMGLALCVATPMAVVKGGTITDNESRKNEKQVWGKQADWCEYGGSIDGQRVAVVLMPHPKNFRRSWFHARDYGLLAANPFGQNAFTRRERSEVVVKKGEVFRLRYGVLIYDSLPDQPVNVAETYRNYSKIETP